MDSQTPLPAAALKNLTVTDILSPIPNRCPNPMEPGISDNLHLLRHLLLVWYGRPNDLFHYMIRFKALKKLECRESFKLSRMLKRITGMLRAKNDREAREKLVHSEFFDILRLSDMQKLREKLEVAQFRNSLSLSDIRMIISYLKYQAPNRESYDLSFLLERIIYVMRSIAKSSPEYREELELAETYIYQLKEQQEVISIIMSLLP